MNKNKHEEPVGIGGWPPISTWINPPHLESMVSIVLSSPITSGNFSIQSGLSFVGVSCSTISKVSNNGGKYGQKRSTLNIECRPRKGGVLSSKALLPVALVIV
jgi:hypothetical protein